ncbi:hypothetical protein KJ786_01165 [Patescibacteria group bacterium]|nr:hypothetical protein [Patescibacteria group bacterium]
MASDKDFISKKKKIDRAKSEFISIASHQLRTPATAIKWYSKILLDKRTGELNLKQKEYLEKIYDNNEKMLELINNLLDVPRTETKN